MNFTRREAIEPWREIFPEQSLKFGSKQVHVGIQLTDVGAVEGPSKDVALKKGFSNRARNNLRCSNDDVPDGLPEARRNYTYVKLVCDMSKSQFHAVSGVGDLF